jgi:hypothetical protein
MKQAMIHAFSERQLQVDAEFAAALEAAIAGFDWKAEVERAAREALKAMVGRTAKQVVVEAIRRASWNEGLQGAAVEAVAKALQEISSR